MIKKLSGANYGGYEVENKNVVLYSEEREILDTVSFTSLGDATVNGIVYTNVLDINGFLYSLEVSEVGGQYDYIGTAN